MQMVQIQIHVYQMNNIMIKNYADLNLAYHCPALIFLLECLHLCFLCYTEKEFMLKTMLIMRCGFHFD